MKTFSLNPIFPTSFKGTFMALVFLSLVLPVLPPEISIFIAKVWTNFLKSFSSIFSFCCLLFCTFDEVIGNVFCDVQIYKKEEKKKAENCFANIYLLFMFNWQKFMFYIFFLLFFDLMMFSFIDFVVEIDFHIVFVVNFSTQTTTNEIIILVY